MPTKFLHRAVCVLSCAAIASGCGKKRVQTVADGPALVMPAPPSRVFAPIEDEEPIASTAPEAQPARAPVLTTTTKPAAKPKPTEAERTEQAPPAPAVAPTPEPQRELRAASSPADAESEKKIGDVMRRAQQTLNNVYYQGLSAQRKELYDLAKEILKDAGQQLKARNFIYAETQAAKAEKLAADLLGRSQ